MNTPKSKRLALTLALTGAVLPLTLIGCGGGGGGLLSPRPTTRPNPTATSSPTTPIALTPTTFTLQNGQRVTLTGTRTGNALAGKLAVAAAPQPKLASGAQNATFPFQIAVGEYGFTGTFTPPRGFSITGNFGSLGNFNMSGQLQTATENGSYSLTTNGVTDSGILPATGNPPAPNATATPTPPTSGYQITALTPLTFTDVTAGSPIVTTPIASFLPRKEDKGFYNLDANNALESLAITGSDSDFVAPGKATSRGVTVVLAAGPFTVGREFPMNAGVANTVQVAQLARDGAGGGHLPSGARLRASPFSRRWAPIRPPSS